MQKKLPICYKKFTTSFLRIKENRRREACRRFLELVESTDDPVRVEKIEEENVYLITYLTPEGMKGDTAAPTEKRRKRIQHTPKP